MKDDYFAWAVDQDGMTVFGPERYDAIDAAEAANMILGDIYQRDIEFDVILVAPNRNINKYKISVQEIYDND